MEFWSILFNSWSLLSLELLQNAATLWDDDWSVWANCSFKSFLWLFSLKFCSFNNLNICSNIIWFRNQTVHGLIVNVTHTHTHTGTHWGAAGRYSPSSRPSRVPGRRRWSERRPAACCRWRPRTARSSPRSSSLGAPSSPCSHLQRRRSRDRLGACAHRSCIIWDCRHDPIGGSVSTISFYYYHIVFSYLSGQSNWFVEIYKM